jgi:hypothetical protein
MITYEHYYKEHYLIAGFGEQPRLTSASEESLMASSSGACSLLVEDVNGDRTVGRAPARVPSGPMEVPTAWQTSCLGTLANPLS